MLIVWFFMQARGPNKVGARRVGARRVGARRVGARRVGGSKIRAFFSSPRHKIRSFLPSLGSFRGIFVVFEASGRSNVHVWSSLVVVCEPRRLRGRAVQGKGGPGEGRSREGRSKPNFETNTRT